MTKKDKIEEKVSINSTELSSEDQLKKCFVIMPIADREGYDPGHFHRVYTEIIIPACEAAGFIAERADDASESHHIVLNILRSIVNYDMAICDLSSANPNVLYELGIRQMAKQPVTLIKDDKTGKIFDIDFIKYASYASSLRSDLVKEAIRNISSALERTHLNKDEITQQFMDQLGTQLKIEEKTIDVSPSEKLILSRIDELANLMSSRTENDTVSKRLAFGVAIIMKDPYGRRIGSGVVVYYNNKENTETGLIPDTFYFVQRVERIKTGNISIYKVFVINLKSGSREIHELDTKFSDFIVVEEKLILDMDVNQYKNYLKHKTSID